MYQKKDKKGFTLVELLVALSILSCIGMGFYNVLNSTIKGNAKNEQDINALQIAQSEIENIRVQIKSNSNLESVDKDGNKVILNKNGLTKYKKYENNNIYDVQVTISENSSDQMYEIKLFVKLDNEKFNKKTTKIITQIFGG